MEPAHFTLYHKTALSFNFSHISRIISIDMNPANNQPRHLGTPTPPTRSQPFTPPPRTTLRTPQTAAAEVIRGQIGSIYAGNSGENTPHTTPTPVETTAQPTTHSQYSRFSTQSARQSTNARQPQHNLRTTPPDSAPKNQEIPESLKQQSSAHQPQNTADQWNQYHSSWQKYYQMYYERYYTNHLATKQQEMQAFIQENTTKISANEIQKDPNDESTDSDTISQTDAVKELRSEIRQKVRQSAQKVQKSRHFIPTLAGVLVVFVFLFLQYNRVIFGAVAAYTTPGNIEPQNIIVDPTVNIEVGPEPRMVIPKINIDAPVVYGVGADHASQMKAMESGIAHFAVAGANAVPGQVGNAVFAAHSSNDAFARGDYKFVFAQNEKLTKDDVIYMNYEGKRYTYKVTSMEVVMPTEVSKIQLQTDKPMLTLISCVPLGTAEKRLLVFAEQISPDPSDASDSKTDASSDSDSSASVSIPGQPAPTLLERLFGS